MDINRIKNAIKIVKFAMENGVSVRSASVFFGYSPTYYKNVRIVVDKKIKSGELKKDNDLVKELKGLHKKYKEIKLNSENNTISFKDDGNSGVLESKSKRIETVEDLLKRAKIDITKWRVKNKTINTWDTTSWIDGKPSVNQNYQIKVWLEKNDEVIKNGLAEEVFNNVLQKYTPPIYKPTKFEIKNNLTQKNNLLEVSIFDLHFGKLAWCGETGENFDTKIAAKRFIGAITDLIESASKHGVSRILFPIGNDFFNSDNLNNTTTAGTPQDEDLRWQKTFDDGLSLIISGVDMLKELNVPIDILVIRGNHDFERSYYLGSCVSAWFRNDPMVCVDNRAISRKYYKFGDVLLGFSHGKYEKQDSLPMLMATEKESKEMWAETKFREWHLGHIHRKRNDKYTILDKNRTLNEDFGIVIRYLSSLTGTEEWHYKMGFVSQIKGADGFLWNDKEGLIVQFNTNITIE